MEEEITEKLKPLVRLLARQAAREHFEQALAAQQRMNREDGSTPGENEEPDGDDSPTKPG